MIYYHCCYYFFAITILSLLFHFPLLCSFCVLFHFVVLRLDQVFCVHITQLNWVHYIVFLTILKDT